MLLPVVAWFFIFCYMPMGGIIMAFENYKFGKGLLGSQWVGFKNFTDFFGSYYFTRLLGNTLALSVYDLCVSFPAAIIFALLLNEVHNRLFKRTIQTVSYLPYFISMVVVCGLVKTFTESGGALSLISQVLGGPSELISNAGAFRSIVVGSNLWQNLGYGSIIYISALGSIDTELYEAARIDGAGHFRLLWSVVLPVSKSILAVVTLFYAIQIWNSWFHTAIYVTDRSLYPLQIILREIVLQNSASSETGDPNEVNVIQVLIKYCVIMMSIIPMMVLYPFIQKYFVSGVMIGSIKG